MWILYSQTTTSRSLVKMTHSDYNIDRETCEYCTLQVQHPERDMWMLYSWTTTSRRSLVKITGSNYNFQRETCEYCMLWLQHQGDMQNVYSQTTTSRGSLVKMTHPNHNIQRETNEYYTLQLHDQSHISRAILQATLCHLEVICAKVPELVEKKKMGEGIQSEQDLLHKIVQGDQLTIQVWLQTPLVPITLVYKGSPDLAALPHLSHHL